MQNEQTNPAGNPTASTGNPTPAQPGQPAYVVPKSATAAGLLGIFLGSFGAHDWYLGDNKKGLLHVSLFGGGFIVAIFGAVLAALTAGIPLIAVLFGLIAMLGYLVLLGNCIWGLIEGIIILSQGDAGLAAKGYPIAAPQVIVQNPATTQPAQPAATTVAQPTAQPTTTPTNAPAETPAEKAPATNSKPAETKSEAKPETKSEKKPEAKDTKDTKKSA